ncbi:tRNA (adenosine(37)-N6)-dimethylallyltransferase MiaA [Candidatus Saccharibacteria bacterium RIFCSPHIGHO2_01_FULL_45_15]|jgi:tRNA dimethylallyltransferase|nr:MAG: tRNA (adenosine(37)-N6)-dimethylallyltransferase MiaA [Candidatus Saccharibacteria bacterium RIFCSPHIGHO2_01_FULL_45_15]OGL27410.1 MAG: tRNA (adenosine(37)-N6)-dimethylallyltransferase MiaA [Candidatus Saccharibacteria bacterium RIFCSPHIGHO2_02_FULL_46_12]OGL32625.1 MAG: tRNA (adenosine(37)-N6)-dimethylallyltransferase MiaA [Candidatus Saccharibacteria bacterium RIFCSPHIGHO2_12_FULL_44_22]
MEVGSMSGLLPLIVIQGPTASGKTRLAIELAKRFNGEIICADSRTVYKYMDIGTAKPTPLERKIVPHWGLDIVEPGTRFTAADFKEYAVTKIQEIRAREHVPFLVGGTGLYIDGVVFNYTFGSNANDVLRKEFDTYSIEELQNYCIKNNIDIPENKNNKRYLIRAIEQKSEPLSVSSVPIDSSIIVGIATEKDNLRERIQQRTEQLFECNVVEESIKLGEMYGWDNEAMTGNIYRLVKSYLDDEQTLAEIKEKNTTLDWRLAKRQLTWMRRNPYIQWMPLDEAEHYLSNILVATHKS